MSMVLAQIRGRTTQALKAASLERARGYVLDIQEIIDEHRTDGSPEPVKAAIETLVEELRTCEASPDPRATDVLIEALDSAFGEATGGKLRVLWED